MKMFIAITCFALVAVALGEETASVPHSLGGSLLRTKGGLLNSAADRWDRWVHGFRGLVPLGNFGVNIAASIPAKPTETATPAPTPTSTAAVTPGVVASTVPSGTVGVNITSPVDVIECGRKKFLETQLKEVATAIKTSKEAIENPTTGLKKLYTDAAEKPEDTVEKFGIKYKAMLKALGDLTKAEERFKHLQLQERQLLGQLEVYAACKD